MSECRNRHGAIITMGGRIMAVGVNSERNNPRIGYEIDPVDLSTHAEIAALRALNGQAKGAKVYIARWRHRSNEIGLSRPCENCYNALVDAGVKEIIYT